jgi:peptidoglycan/LPS O-acetylase OafA/YrhL
VKEGRQGNAFDFLRLLAALAVVVQHATVHLHSRFFWVDPYDHWWFYDGVKAFFVISGFFVFRSAVKLHSRKLWVADFARNRALRIFPAIWVYSAVTLAALLVLSVLSVGDLIAARSIAWVLSTLLLVPVYSPPALTEFGTGVINGSLWTIPVEVSFYATVPLLVLLERRLGTRRFLTGILGAGALFAAIQAFAGDDLPAKLYGISFLPYLWYFALGILWFRIEGRVALTWSRAAMAVFGYALATWGGGDMSHTFGVLSELVAAIPLSYLVVILGRLVPSIFNRLISGVGDLSFGVYIWHMVVINFLLWAGVRDHLSGTGLVAFVIAISLALAWLSWHLVERPALALKHRTSRAAS